MLVPMVASIAPSWIRSSSDLLGGPCSIFTGLSSGSTVGEPCAPAALIAPCTQVHFEKSTPWSCCRMPRMKIAAVMV